MDIETESHYDLGESVPSPDAPVTSTLTDAPASRRLTDCTSGCRVMIDIESLEHEDRSMLEAMGVEHGIEVEICQVGSPCILKVHTTRLGVGHAVARRIMTTPTG